LTEASRRNNSSRASRIVADIGGTNGRFAIVRGGAIVERREYRNSEFPDLATLVRRYLDDAGSSDDDVDAACLAVAAPVSEDGEAKFTNAPWKVSARELKVAMKLDRVALINDFAAQAYGLLTLGDVDVAAVAKGVTAQPASRSARVVLGPGTGLGCAALVPAVDDRQPPVAVTSEGGHMGFAAETDDDRRIFDAAHAKFGRTSWERVCCGAGLALVHCALFPGDALAGVEQGDPSEVVKRARADRASDAARSVRQFCGMLGAFAGDLALVFRAEGGVYLTGGVLGHLGEAFDAAAFLERFVDKGRYRAWLSGLPVSRITADDVPLRGCAQYLEMAPA
jgi:glucokinase